MMVSAVACIIGNLAYCLSYDAKSLALLVIARLITGFGASSLSLLMLSQPSSLTHCSENMCTSPWLLR